MYRIEYTYDFKILRESLQRAGIKKSTINKALPYWWDKECENGNSSIRFQGLLHIATNLKIDLAFLKKMCQIGIPPEDSTELEKILWKEHYNCFM